jgi:hypothetical protein
MALIALALLAETSLAGEPTVPGSAVAPSGPASPAAKDGAPVTLPAAPVGCLPSGNGFLRARIRGALSLDVNLQDSELECEGAARPDGSGIRLSFAGPLQSDGRRLRMVFGVADAAEGTAGKALPTNLTVIFEGEQRLFSTRGEDRCTVDSLKQERIGALSGPTRAYRVIARGFCIEPVSSLSANERLVVSSFDFAGKILFTKPEPGVPPATPATPVTKVPR